MQLTLLSLTPRPVVGFIALAIGQPVGTGCAPAAGYVVQQAAVGQQYPFPQISKGTLLRARGRRERCPHRFGHLHTATPPPVVGRHVSTLDARIDELYALPLAEFTAARNALAKTVKGDDATRVKRLEKPSLVPWAVNQLYWRERRTYDRLIASGEALRSGPDCRPQGADQRRTRRHHGTPRGGSRRRSHGQPACRTGRRAAVRRAAVTHAGSAVAVR